MGTRATQSFGISVDEDPRLQAEPSVPACAPEEVETVLEGYRALDARSGGRYAEFLRGAARCRRCAGDPSIPVRKQPLPMLCGHGGLDGAGADRLRAAHEALEAYRREDRSLRFAPEDPAAARAVESLLDEHGLGGLSIGHCGWGDLTARLRGAQLAEGVDLMILGADWYPLTQCSRFLLDRYDEVDSTFGKFLRKLTGQAGEVGDFFRRHRVYLGNTLLCYRTGWARTGDANLSPRSFDHCGEHLARHVDAVAPRVLVTFGKQAARSVARILTAPSPSHRRALDELGAGQPLGQVMERLYATEPVRGIEVSRSARELRLVPLSHPSWGHVNSYRGEYEGLRAVVGIDGSRAGGPW